MSYPPGWIIHRYQTVATTMDVAARLASVGARDRTAVVSAAQTAGRGRAGRAWQAPAGSGLFCTLLLRPTVEPGRLSTLPLLVGVAVAEAIEHLSGREVRLKWPNDIWLGPDADSAKVAGILVASRLAGQRVDYALVGIGVNVSSPRTDLPPGATSLRAAGSDTSVDELLVCVLERCAAIYSGYLAAAGRPSLAAWRARAALLGEAVTVEERGRVRHGTFVDVDDEGGLLLQDAAGTIERIVAGDLVRGPRRDGRPASARSPAERAESGSSRAKS